MLMFILRRIGTMLLTMLALTFIVFYLVTLPGNLEKLAKTEGEMRMTDAEVQAWLDKEGFNRPFLVQYGEWIGNTVRGDMGWSRVFRKPVSEVIGERLGYTGILMFWVMAVMVPGALIIGVLAGMKEGSTLDRTLTVGSVASTSAPEYVTGIVFTVIFASALGWFKGIASTRSITFENFTLPVMTMAIYGMGYIARMTRASMAEVMTSQYIRTARLKGLSFRSVVLKHALRNALIAPFTVIMLQFPWLLTGVVVVETMFNYKGFGFALVEAAGNNDINLLLAISWVAVIVVLLTQLISDIGYAYLNPRIRVS
ncbi:ABC transporter permease [Limibaculum sp. M0105]|uniref:ABC transporter permease n=1 Tax=Thermohalobaculum xanthum TaxID=2753746 RepID=A0A8J7SC47_9RHOB|nr:ABC transporter permease [Thermohalobaculum xanthum]MBK0398026.1 ABC transporter permease [Thermohalobaculum xanthum]